MIKIFLGLGSNLGNKEENINNAINELSKIIFNVKVAPLYISKAWGITDQPDFINTSVSGETDMKPVALLQFVKNVEEKVGRVETYRWGPREIDIDILLYGNQVYEDDTLQIPHAGLHERDTALVPLLELDAALIHPVLQKSMQQILNEFPADKRSIVKKL